MPFTCAFADERGIVRSVPRIGARPKVTRLNQFARRNLSKYDRSVLALQLEPLYAAEAKRRQAATQFGSTVVQNSAPPQDTGKTVEKLAKLAGTSRDTIRKVKVIETEAAKATETAQTFAKVGIYADQRIGEILRELPKGGRWSDSPTGKTDAIKDAGFTPKTAYQLEQLAATPDVVQAVLDKAEATIL